MQFLQQKRKCKKGCVSLKLDMNKAYDPMRWSFLEKVMLIMSVGTKVLNLIMQCVRSVTFSIRINGDAQGPITSSRALRQGDPLSPFLFLLCNGGFKSLVNNLKDRKDISAVKICKRAHSINHVLFVDDNLLFVKKMWRKIEKYNSFWRNMKRKRYQGK